MALPAAGAGLGGADAAGRHVGGSGGNGLIFLAGMATSPDRGGSAARVQAEMERLRTASAAQQAAQEAQLVHRKLTGSSGYGAQSPSSTAPQADWLRSRQAEQRALTSTVTAALRAWPGPGEAPVFQHIAEAFAFIDADGMGGISEFELAKGLRLLGLRDTNAARLIAVIDPQNRGSGNLTARQFMKSLYFDNDGGRAKMFASMDEGLQKQKHLDAILLEAVIKRRKILSAVNKALHKRSEADRWANEQRLAQQKSEINAAHDTALRKLQEELQRAGFANPSEAYCFFDADGGKSSVISHVDLVVGLRRLKIDHLFDLDVLQWALEGGGMRDNACMYSEWMRNVAWGEHRGQGIVEQNAALDEANHRRRLINRRILAGVKERERNLAEAEAEAAKIRNAKEIDSQQLHDVDETEDARNNFEGATSSVAKLREQPSASSGLPVSAGDTGIGCSAELVRTKSDAQASLDPDAAMVMQGSPDLPLGGAKHEKEPLRYRWFPDPSFCLDEPANQGGSKVRHRSRPHSAKPISSARPLSATSQRRSGRKPRPASATSATNRSRVANHGPLLSRSFADNTKDRPLLERSWKADFWITDQKAPGTRGNRCGWQMPPRPLSADLGTTIRKPSRPRPARPQSALGPRDWSEAERQRAETAQQKLAKDEESVVRLEEQISRARKEAKGRFGETDWDVFMPGKFSPQPGFNGVPLPGEQVSKLPERPDRQKELQKAAFDQEDAEMELRKAQESLNLLERMGATKEELAEGRARVHQATSDVAAYKAVAAQKKIEVLAEEAEYNAATDEAFQMTTFSDPLKPAKIVVPDIPETLTRQLDEFEARNTIWVGQIPDELASTTADAEQVLRDSFGDHGSIASVTVRLKQNVAHRSWALVTFKDPSICDKILESGVQLKDADGHQIALEVRKYDADAEMTYGRSGGTLEKIVSAQHASLRNLEAGETLEDGATKQKKKKYIGQTSLKAKDLKASRRQVARLQNRCVGVLQNLELYGTDHPEMMLAGLQALDCMITHSPSEATVALQQVAAGRRLTKLLSRHARLPLATLVQNVEDRFAADLKRKRRMEEAKKTRLEAEEVGRRLAEEADKASRQWNQRVERQAAGLDPDDEEDEHAAELAARELQSERERAAETRWDGNDEHRSKDAHDKEPQRSDFTPEQRAQLEREDVHALGLELLYRLAHRGKRAANHVGRGNDGLAEGLSQVQIRVPRKPKLNLSDAMLKWDGLVGSAVATATKQMHEALESEEEKRAKAQAAEKAAAAQAAEEKEAEARRRETERKKRVEAKKKAIATARALEESQQKRLLAQSASLLQEAAADA